MCVFSSAHADGTEASLSECSEGKRMALPPSAGVLPGAPVGRGTALSYKTGTLLIGTYIGAVRCRGVRTLKIRIPLGVVETGPERDFPVFFFFLGFGPISFCVVGG